MWSDGNILGDARTLQKHITSRAPHFLQQVFPPREPSQQGLAEQNVRGNMGQKLRTANKLELGSSGTHSTTEEDSNPSHKAAHLVGTKNPNLDAATTPKPKRTIFFPRSGISPSTHPAGSNLEQEHASESMDWAASELGC